MTTYDDFAGGAVDPARWQFLEVPLGPGETWRYADPAAAVTVADGAVTVRIPEFTLANPAVQILDNPKYLMVSTEEFDLTAGPRTFGVRMAATTLGADGSDYRDGFAAFNVLDMATAQVFDAIATGRHAYAIHERLLVPGVVDPADAFTHVVHAPLAGDAVKAGEFQHYAVTIDRAAERVEWRAGGALVYTVRAAALPERVRIGFGIITLHPLADGRSTSLRGQGLAAAWRDFTVD
ncbi:DUF6081 family protein [Nocardia sp. NPDC057353]|uniref:DUF6081 family protein n=1 Tax=Nocardia sp. NPDC057353 TaxID=3346104 RepID=UPI003628D972